MCSAQNRGGGRRWASWHGPTNFRGTSPPSTGKGVPLGKDYQCCKDSHGGPLAYE